MKGFKKYQELLKLDYGTVYRKLRWKPGKVNRISARVHFAESFQSVKSKGYTKETMIGYNGMFQNFLSYSAFEGFLELFNKIKFYDVDTTFPKYKYVAISKKIRSFDKQEKFIDSVHSQLTHASLKKRLTSFQDGETNNPIILAAAIRHTFAHGKLSANTNDANPEHVAEICSLLSNLIFEIMDTEFEKKINSIYDEIKSNAKKKTTKAKKKKN